MRVPPVPDNDGAGAGPLLWWANSEATLKVLEMTTQQLNLLAVIGIAVCWGAVVLAWLGGAIYYQSREPAERTRASYLSPY
jgi:hypothetical protein